MLTIATKRFYSKANDIVFKSLSGDCTSKKADDFQMNELSTPTSNTTKVIFLVKTNKFP